MSTNFEWIKQNELTLVVSVLLFFILAGFDKFVVTRCWVQSLLYRFIVFPSVCYFVVVSRSLWRRVCFLSFYGGHDLFLCHLTTAKHSIWNLHHSAKFHIPTQMIWFGQTCLVKSVGQSCKSRTRRCAKLKLVLRCEHCNLIIGDSMTCGCYN
jgi:hypothetical protein